MPKSSVHLLFLWMILQLSFPTLHGIVHQLYSSISSVQRSHGCEGELLTFTCTTSGEWMEWKGINGTLQLRFLHTHPVNQVLTSTNITAILLDKVDREIPTGMGKNFTSVIFIKLTNSTLPSNITCASSLMDNVSLSFSVAEYPRPPESINITQVGTGDTLIQYRMKWSLPPNIEEFDLDHYELTIGNNITYNIDGDETTVIISTGKETLTTAIVVDIVAVDRCGSKSRITSENLTADPLPGSLDNGKNTRVCKSTCAMEISISIVPTFILLMVGAVLMCIVVLKLKKQRHIKHSDSEHKENHEPSDKPKERYAELEESTVSSKSNESQSTPDNKKSLPKKEETQVVYRQRKSSSSSITTIKSKRNSHGANYLLQPSQDDYA